MRKTAWAAALLGGLLLLAAAACGILNLSLGQYPARPPAGPMPARSKYRVAVLGDTQKGLTNFSNLLREVRKEEPAFILHTGDLVSDNDEGHYRLPGLYLHRAGVQVPFFVAPGNHDLKGGDDRFVREFDALERSFRVGDVAFVLVNNGMGAPPDPARVESLILNLEPARAVVLAMHVPPFDVKGEPLPEYGPFLKWLETSKVAYLLTGHVHTYLRKTVGSTIVIVNGVGGDYDSWQLDQKACATILEVDGPTIVDRKIELPAEHGLRENVEHFAIGHLAEAYRKRPVLCWAGTMVLAIVVGFSVGVIRQRP